MAFKLVKPRSSGWWDISATLESGWSGGVYVKRTETSVMVRVHGLSAATATGNTPFTLPSGLRSDTWSAAINTRGLLHTATDPVVVRRTFMTSGGALRMYSYSPTDVLYGDLRFDTADPWPAMFPGVKL